MSRQFLVLLTFALSFCTSYCPAATGQSSEKPAERKLEKCDAEILIKKPASATSKSNSVPAADDLPPKGISESIIALSKVERFDGSRIGLAATASSNFKAFAAVKATPELMPQIQWLLNHSKGAPRLYSALLIYKVNKKDGLHAFDLLSADQTVIAYNFGGCCIETGPVSKVASLLKKNPAPLANFSD